jgi:hypothetical protein
MSRKYDCGWCGGRHEEFICPESQEAVYDAPRKFCGKCKQLLDKSNFWKERRLSDGLGIWCKTCHYSSERRRYNAIKAKESLERYPQKTAARNLVKNSVRSGKLIKENCFFCDDPKTDGHHLDYDYPLKVVWLCRKHHLGVHDVSRVHQ